MKKHFVIALCVATLVVVSCSKSSSLERVARQAIIVAVTEGAAVPESVQLKSQRTLYADPTLCIMQMDFTCKNRLGMELPLQCEGVYMLVDGESYVAFHDIDFVALNSSEMENVFAFGNEMVYLSPEDFEKIKKGEIIEDLTYVEALYYRAELLINYRGHKMGDDTDEPMVKIPVLTGTGLWQMKHHVDEFHNDLESNSIFLVGAGKYSTSARSDIPLLAMLIFDNSRIKFKLFENKKYLVSNHDFVIKVRDSNGVVHDGLLFTNNDGDVIPASPAVLEEILAIVKQGGIITVSAQSQSKLFSRNYVFKMDLSGFNRAKSYLHP